MIVSSHLKSQRTQYYPIQMLLLLLGCVLTTAAATGGTTVQGIIPETGLRYWEWQGEGILLRLTQRLPDQTRAFFLARGFSAEDADFLARKCVFQTLFKNTNAPGGKTVSYSLDEWNVHTAGITQGMLTREHWHGIWEARTLAQPARIAFEWSLLPTRQVYQPEDYNWGMTSFGLEPDTRFDLEFFWQQNGARFSGYFEDVECPADLHPEAKR
jgi:hypothetical protein